MIQYTGHPTVGPTIRCTISRADCAYILRRWRRALGTDVIRHDVTGITGEVQRHYSHKDAFSRRIVAQIILF